MSGEVYNAANGANMLLAIAGGGTGGAVILINTVVVIRVHLFIASTSRLQ